MIFAGGAAITAAAGIVFFKEPATLKRLLGYLTLTNLCGFDGICHRSQKDGLRLTN